MFLATNARLRLDGILLNAFLLFLAVAIFMLPLAPLRKVCMALLIASIVCGVAVALLRKQNLSDVPSIALLACVILIILPNASNPDFWGFHLAYFGQILVVGAALFWVLRLLPLRELALCRVVLLPVVLHSWLLLGIGLYRYYFAPPKLFTFIDSSGELVSRFYFYDNPNLAAIFATLSFALLLPFCVAPARHMRILAFVGVVALAASLFLLASRMAIAIMALCVGVFLVWNFHYKLNRKHIVSLIALFASFIALFFMFHIEVFMLKILYGNEPRPTLWAEGLATYLASGQILFGLGAGGFMQIDFSPFWGEESRNMWHAHNLFLQILIEYGLLALLAFCAFLVLLLRSAAVPNSPQSQAFWLVVGAFLLFGLVEFSFWERNALWALILFAVLGKQYGT